MGDKATFAVQVDKDSELYEDFEKYKQRGGFTSTSETLRHLMRAEFDDTDDAGPTGLGAALSKVAGEQLTQQLGMLSRYIIAVAVSLMAIEFGIPGGPLWFAPVVFFGFLTFTTLLGVGVGFAEVLDVTAGQSAGSSSDTADEVEA